jgi:hypothetical protein
VGLAVMLVRVRDEMDERGIRMEGGHWEEFHVGLGGREFGVWGGRNRGL